ncbi:hypothetical protein [Fluoribacter gormanii]|uniref:hypothetical protein n=1 Tax=Fluoribacter gormanii TaxID=464 RepID=UPI0010418D99|nr:hypothetical protein [Fluoribacter gormanii]
MGFKIPNLDILIKSAQQLVISYQKTRVHLDEQRFFASILPKTHNPERLNDAAFIEKIALHISMNRFNYSNMDPDYKNKNYSNCIAPFLKEVLTGALLLELIKISNSYSNKEDVKRNSALGQIILTLFDINEISDVSEKQLHRSLSKLYKYMEIIEYNENKKGNSNFLWHKTKSNEELKQEINVELKKLSSENQESGYIYI